MTTVQRFRRPRPFECRRWRGLDQGLLAGALVGYSTLMAMLVTPTPAPEVRSQPDVLAPSISRSMTI